MLDSVYLKSFGFVYCLVSPVSLKTICLHVLSRRKGTDLFLYDIKLYDDDRININLCLGTVHDLTAMP